MSLGSIAFAEDKAPDREGPGREQPPPPTFEQWVEGGKKIPQGLTFTGGSPFFNPKHRQEPTAMRMPTQIIFGIPGNPRPGTGGPDPRPEVEKPDPRVEEYRKLEQVLAGNKAWSAKAERDLAVKIAEANRKSRQER